jgi:hypothetical protein
MSLESRHGRFGIQICEGLGRLNRHTCIVSAGMTHLVVPVLEHGWQEQAGEVHGINAGTKVTAGNGLAIQRFYEDSPAPTLVTVAGPPGIQQQYLTTSENGSCLFEPERRDHGAARGRAEAGGSRLVDIAAEREQKRALPSSTR